MTAPLPIPTNDTARAEEPVQMQVQVAVPLFAISGELSYSVPTELATQAIPGMRVIIPVGKRKFVGVITANNHISSVDGTRLRPIEQILDELPLLSPEQIELCRFVASYYVAPFGEVIKLCLPPGTQALLKTAKIGKKAKLKAASHSHSQHAAQSGLVAEASPATLSPHQNTAISTILTNPPGAYLLEGVTGSGKTQVYLEVARALLAKGLSSLFIVPEIALTEQLLARLQAFLGEPVVLLHSNLTPAARREALFTLATGNARIVLGARSALFAPVKNLGLIVVDEEHEPSFKQEESPRYHARDVAIYRAKLESAIAILGSATPSLESLYNVDCGKLTHLMLPERVSGARTLPKIEVVDLRARKAHRQSQREDRAKSEGSRISILSRPLKEALAACLAAKQQALLFLNKRGYAGIVVCDTCGHMGMCKECSVSLTYYKSKNAMLCHQCGHTERATEKCPECSNDTVALGLGTERIEDEVRALFPDARTGRLDRDAVRDQSELQELLTQTQAGLIDVLIGTQMLAKGHHFPNVTLVGVVLADTALSMPDFRAAERAFHTLVQVAGRAGRGDEPARVIFQTFNPEHPAIGFARTHDTEGFVAYEKAIRAALKKPPFVRSALVRVESTDPRLAKQLAGLVADDLRVHIAHTNVGAQCQVLGPAPAPYEKLRGFTRYHLFISTLGSKLRSQLIAHIQNMDELKKSVRQKRCRLIVDVDPVHML
jgi:primosomal protein N' (replication factor Y)